jgi:uncharacterized membrane protein
LLHFAVGIYAYPQLPENVASHWNIEGKVDGYMPKFLGVFLLPSMAAGVTLLFIAIPRIEPLKSNLEQFKEHYNGFIVVILAFFFYLYLLTILWNAGVTFSLMQLLTPAIGIVIYASGVLVEKAKRNWFVGIRTPWTLSNETVWKKTHEQGGKLFKIAGAMSIIGVLFGSYLTFLFMLVPVLSVAVYSIVYSYVEYQKIAN